MFSLSITNSSRPRKAHLIGHKGACLDSNILALLARFTANEWVVIIIIIIIIIYFYLSEIGEEFLGNRMNESISLRFQP